MYKLNKYQEKWLKALESGKYKQCRGRLHNGKGFCCLGVACDVMGVKPVKLKDGRFVFDGEVSVLPDSVAEKLHMGEEDGGAHTPFKTSKNAKPKISLAGANDAGATFKGIARVIRKDPENFFR